MSDVIAGLRPAPPAPSSPPLSIKLTLGGAVRRFPRSDGYFRGRSAALSGTSTAVLLPVTAAARGDVIGALGVTLNLEPANPLFLVRIMFGCGVVRLL